MAEFYREFWESRSEIVLDGFDLLIENWIELLDERNKSGKYAFPHFREEPTHLFYFSDHVMIWRALKSVESVGVTSSELKAHSSKSYSPITVKTNIISRFTTMEDSFVKRRMLAVSRSPSENGFLFQPEDTVLFYAMDMGFFDKPGMKADKSDIWINKIDVWKSVVDCQVQHEDNQDVYWVNPLQFALALVLSTRNKGANSMPATEMYSYSKNILFGSSSRNGLFPGYLDENKEPLIFSDESKSEDYWYTTFEVPYILWSYLAPLPQKEQNLQMDSLLRTVTAEQVTVPNVSKIYQVLEDILTHKDMASSQEGVFLRRSMPFNNIIDKKNIANLSDEWLYNEPQIFNHTRDIANLIEEFLAKKDSNANRLSIRADDMMHQMVKHMTNEAQITEAQNTEAQNTEVQNTEAQNPNATIGYIVDVPKTKHHQKNKADPVYFWINEDMYALLGKMRTREEAKKRLFVFSRANPLTALAFYLASPDSEKEQLSFFFRRHATYDKYFNEEVTPVLNRWVTEFHLSFYQIVDGHKTPINSCIPPLDQIKLPSINSPNKKTWISRVIMSFRFDGDFFNRYWTCHFLEFDPQCLGENTLPDLLKADDGASKPPWKQRQVLELILVDRILDIKQGILRRSMGHESGPVAGPIPVFSDPLHLFADISSKSMADSARQIWRQFQHLLQGVEDDLGDNLVKIGLWRNREQERGLNRPRWTIKDERRYRGAISKRLSSINQKIRELEQIHADIGSLKASLIKRLEIAQEEWETRNTNSIRLFTKTGYLGGGKETYGGKRANSWDISVRTGYSARRRPYGNLQ
ncbi:uncharacterized protein TRIVIDRAFT_205375 [Trichoderma virens Gv29-8]|uniref:Uncharacterized protein n=1 Tax=Hypocrea virens (strain Gv29-8 / FGSC 10586) TaxID=413071 RepID=G9N672_HYPVG|nr:uncharacterized protein TRIVIDRAFT_205375 [Trichoderma virens Gv29-8]EHK17634.1 hypothetical protein TRIVIDRAFT_205375 [Trichoderma virens Gv29-8]